MKTASRSMLLLSLAALAAATAPAAAQEEGQEQQEDQQAEERERERVRTVTVRHGGDNVFVLGGGRGWLGVRVDDVDRAAADSLGLDEVRGARVLGVEEESPAATAGLEEGDVIVGFDGETVRSVAELVRLVRETPPGRDVELRVVRDGSSRSLDVTLTERDGFSFGMPGMRHMQIRGLDDLPEGLSEERMKRLRMRMKRAGERKGEAMERLHEHMGQLDSLRDAGVFEFHLDGRPRLGVRLQPLTDQLADYFGVGDRGGALITSVQEGSPAGSAGLRAGDVVVSFGDEEVSDVGELMRAVHGAEAGPTTVTVVRGGEERSVTVELPEPEAEGSDWSGAFRRGGAAPTARPAYRVLPAPAAPGVVAPRSVQDVRAVPAPRVYGVRPVPAAPAVPAPGSVEVVRPAAPAPSPTPAVAPGRTLIL